MLNQIKAEGNQSLSNLGRVLNAFHKEERGASGSIDNVMMVFVAALILVAGVVGEVHGRKKACVAGLLLAAAGAALSLSASSLGVLLAGLFFSAVQTGGFGMERATEVPRELSRVLQALIILFIAAQSSFNFGRGRIEERET